jgi:hypothetical protein
MKNVERLPRFQWVNDGDFPGGLSKGLSLFWFCLPTADKFFLVPLMWRRCKAAVHSAMATLPFLQQNGCPLLDHSDPFIPTVLPVNS